VVRICVFVLWRFVNESEREKRFALLFLFLRLPDVCLKVSDCSRLFYVNNRYESFQYASTRLWVLANWAKAPHPAIRRAGSSA
jgi:hypothetical protein